MHRIHRGVLQDLLGRSSSIENTPRVCGFLLRAFVTPTSSLNRSLLDAPLSGLRYPKYGQRRADAQQYSAGGGACRGAGMGMMQCLPRLCGASLGAAPGHWVAKATQAFPPSAPIAVVDVCMCAASICRSTAWRVAIISSGLMRIARNCSLVHQSRITSLCALRTPTPSPPPKKKKKKNSPAP